MKELMYHKTSPIGIIDSGIGGFSVARKVQKLLPNENLLYFGDGANVPYGNHTGDEILTMTRYMIRFMREREVKTLLVACNTISSLIKQYRGDIDCPVLSVVEAGAQTVKSMDLDRVAVVSTCFTANFGCYPRQIGRLSPKTQVVSHGCHDLANIVECNVGDPAAAPIVDQEIQKEFSGLEAEGLEYCVLGCTHFPLVEENIHRLFPSLKLIDPADQMARTVQNYLKENDLENPSEVPGTLDIFTTSSVEEYREKAAAMGLDPVTSVQAYPPMKL